MPVNNGIITSPISVTDIRTALGQSSNDVGTLCKSSSINMLSKYKPVIYAAMNTDDNPNWWKTSAGNCGINIPQLASIQNPSAQKWTYQPPTGGTASPYRMSDFRNYNHNATPDLCSGHRVPLNIDLLASTSFTIGADFTQNPNSLSVSDLDSSMFASYFFTAVVYASDGSTNVCGSANANVANGGKTVTFPTSLFQAPIFQNGTCSCCIGLSYTKFNVGDAVSSTTWYSVYSDDTWINPVPIKFTSSVNMATNPQTFAQKINPLSGTQNMLPASGTYRVPGNTIFYMKLILTNNGTSAVTFNVNTLRMTYTSFTGVRVTFAPTVYKNNNGTWNTVSSESIQIPAGQSLQDVYMVGGNFLWRNASGAISAGSVGTTITTNFEFYATTLGQQVNFGTSQYSYSFIYTSDN